jgi:DNA-directed RNA polymerase specialized sigma24 family protein
LTTDVIASLADSVDEILHVHAALEDLGRIDPRLARVLEMRYFAGMEDAEIAEVMGVLKRTVSRDGDKARLLLVRRAR